MAEAGVEAEFRECAPCAAKSGAPPLCAACLNNRKLVADLRAEKAELIKRVPRQPFDVRCADALADEVAVLVRRQVIDSRSPAGDALLEYRDPPSTPRADRLAILEVAMVAQKQLNADLHKGVCSGYAGVLSEKRQLESSLVAEREARQTAEADLRRLTTDKNEWLEEEERLTDALEAAQKARVRTEAELTAEKTRSDGLAQQRDYEWDRRKKAQEIAAAAQKRSEGLNAALGEARSAINRDRTGLAAGLNAVRGIVGGYQWIVAGEWGSYSYEEHTQETLRKEVGWCFEALLKAAAESLNASGNLADKTVRSIDGALASQPSTVNPAAGPAPSPDARRPPCDFMPEASASKDRLDVPLSAWPIPDVLERLADATDHLRSGHSCDAHGHEGWLYAAQAARAHATALRSKIPEVVSRETRLLRKALPFVRMVARNHPGDSGKPADLALEIADAIDPTPEKK